MKLRTFLYHLVKKFRGNEFIPRFDKYLIIFPDYIRLLLIHSFILNIYNNINVQYEWMNEYYSASSRGLLRGAHEILLPFLFPPSLSISHFVLIIALMVVKWITGKESIQWERFFELTPSKGTRGHRYRLFKKRKGTIGQKFFSEEW